MAKLYPKIIMLKNSYRVCFAACMLAATLLLWLNHHLPMADLPAHMAQLNLWKKYDEPGSGMAQQYDLNFLTPYLLGYAIARLLLAFVSVFTAIKIVVTLAVLGLPLSMHVLLKRAGGERFLALFGFPLAFGFSFYWGFLSFLIAIPIAILLLALALEPSEQKPRIAPWRAVVMTALALLLLMSHGLLFAVVAPSVLLVLLWRAGSIRTALLRAIPGALLLLVAARLFLHLNPGGGFSPKWNFDPFGRLIALPGTLLGFSSDLKAAAGALIMILIIGMMTTPRRDAARFAPGLIAFFTYLFAPESIESASFIYQRFALVTLIFSLIGFVPLSRSETQKEMQEIGRMVVTGLAIMWLLLLGERFRGFNEETAELEALLPLMQPGKRVLTLTFDKWSQHVHGQPFLHLGALYQLEKGGSSHNAFAKWPHMIVRYRPGATLRRRDGLTWTPQRFSMATDLDYDYFVIRGQHDYGPRLWGDAAGMPVLRVRSGKYWLYERIR